MDVSIIIPVFNRQNLVGRAIRSAINQEVKGYEIEIVVINDGSTDHSKEEILKFSKYISYFENKKNIGLPSTRNKGVLNSKGRYIFNLDSDDYIHPKTISTLLTAFELCPHVAAISCDYIYTDILDNKSHPISFKENPIACGIMFKRQVLIGLGLYDEELRVHEEKDLWKRILKENLKVLHLPIPFYRYLQHSDTLSRSSESEYYKKLLKKKYE